MNRRIGCLMQNHRKVVTATLLATFAGASLAFIWQGLLLFGILPGQPAEASPSLQPNQIKSAAVNPSSTPTPFTPQISTPFPPSAAIFQPTSSEISQKPFENFPLSQAFQMGWTEITIFTPWGEAMEFTFQPVEVDFYSPDFAERCPYNQHNACFIASQGGVYALMHSEYPGAVAEQARSVIEGTLYPMETIQRNIEALRGAEVSIQLADGSFLQARVASLERITGVEQIYDLANQRQTQPDLLIIEFCGLPHLQDQTPPVGTTGSVYRLVIAGEGES